ncbi:hypothetical protein GCM10007315_20630 [Gemmobacter tilapiae]|uniref:Uncharacterized protein n=1 Tax=Neogemmobacter tilapiae TaxID=875041 RepID=A0A918TNY3_9RHOB|nr:hypothetical protein GCM10007315_20630 [Gemmobacter tilapiae]
MRSMMQFQKRKGRPQATLSEILGDEPVRGKAQSPEWFAERLPSENTPRDCPDTFLQ